MIFSALVLRVITRLSHESKQVIPMASVQLGDMRKAYISPTLLEDELPTTDPIELFKEWFTTVKEAGLMYEPNAVAVATTTKTGLPSCRMVLLKGFGPEGFVFFTNYKSRKGRQLEENPNGSMLFYWDRHHRQVRVEGRVEKAPESVSDDYFHSRPRDSQISAVVSQQSRPVESRQYLEEQHQTLQEKYNNSDTVIPRPSEWGGFVLKPTLMEFWQGHSSRLHDRIVFSKLAEGATLPPLAKWASNGWIMQRLAP